MKLRKLSSIALLSLTMLSLAACSKDESQTGTSSTAVTAVSTNQTSSTTTASSFSSVDDAIAQKPTEAIVGDESDKSTATQSYDLSEGSITITEAGTYYITGTNSNAQIIVEAPDDAEVTLVLNGVNLTSTSGAAIVGTSAEKIKIKSPEGAVNMVSDSSANVDSAAIDGDTDLTFNGQGTIVVTGNANHAIKSSDDLKVTNGTVFASAVNDAFVGTDSVVFEAGTAVAEAGDKGVKSDQDSGDTEKALIQILEGSVYVKASGEGMSAATIDVQGGTSSISSGDDAVNASSQVLSPIYKQSGGTLSFVSGGDGIDSNGTLAVTGGTIIAIENSSQDNEPVDSDNIQEFSGVTLISGGTNNAFPETESQSYILVGSVNEGDTITIDGVGEFIAPATVSNLIISTSQVESGASYKVTVGSNTSTVTAGQGADAGMGGAMAQAGASTGGGGAPR